MGNEKFIYYTIVAGIQMTTGNGGEMGKLMEKLKVWLNVSKHCHISMRTIIWIPTSRVKSNA